MYGLNDLIWNCLSHERNVTHLQRLRKIFSKILWRNPYIFSVFFLYVSATSSTGVWPRAAAGTVWLILVTVSHSLEPLYSLQADHMHFGQLLLLSWMPWTPMGLTNDLWPVDPNFSLLHYNEKYLFQSLKLVAFENQSGELQMEVP